MFQYEAPTCPSRVDVEGRLLWAMMLVQGFRLEKA